MSALLLGLVISMLLASSRLAIRDQPTVSVGHGRPIVALRGWAHSLSNRRTAGLKARSEAR